MSLIPELTFREIRTKLKKLGFVNTRTRKHETWDNGNGYIVTVQKGRGTVKPDTLRSIAKQSGCSLKEFLAI